MNISREEKKAEAIRRMKKMGYFDLSIKEFEKYDKVMVNEPPIGGPFYTDYYPELEAKIKELEERDNILVYAVIRAYLTDGSEKFTMDSLLYVEDYKEEWEYFDEDIKNSIIMSYTINWTWEDYSEYGSIMVERTAGAGLKRKIA